MKRQHALRALGAAACCAAVLAADAGLALAGEPPSILLEGVVRDFSDTHPDFEQGIREPEKDIVGEQLGADGLPVYEKDATAGSRTTSGRGPFDQWFRDVPGVNRRVPLRLEATRVPASSPALYRYSSDEFFPIDGRLLGNEGRSHNYHFTYELHGTFRYNGGERLAFRGDDDLWVFLNGRLVMDLGGVHLPETGTVNVDAVAGTAGMVRGRTYDFDLFYAERATVGASFQLETNLALQTRIAANCAPSVVPTGRGPRGTIRLRREQLLTNQRIGQAAVLRANAIERWLNDGIIDRDICGGAIGPNALANSVSSSVVPLGPNPPQPPRANPRPLVIAKATRANGRAVRLNRVQLLINQRVYQAAVRRANALQARLDGKLTGGDIRNGTVTAGRLHQDLRITAASDGPNPLPASRTEVAATGAQSGGNVRLNLAQVQVNQRIAAAAVRRLNALRARINAGLTKQNFAPRSIGKVDLAGDALP